MNKIRDFRLIAIDELSDLVCLAYCCNKMTISDATELLGIDSESFVNEFNFWLNKCNTDMIDVFTIKHGVK